MIFLLPLSLLFRCSFFVFAKHFACYYFSSSSITAVSVSSFSTKSFIRVCTQTKKRYMAYMRVKLGRFKDSDSYASENMKLFQDCGTDIVHKHLIKFDQTISLGAAASVCH